MIKSIRSRWTGYVARMKEGRSVLTGKSIGKKPLGRHGSRCEDNVKMNPIEIGEFIELRTGTTGGPLLMRY